MPVVTVYPSMIKTESPMNGKKGNTPTRGKICGYSAKSRKRFLELIHSLVFEKPLLITMTYKEVMQDGKRYHDDLKAFRMALERAYGRTRVIWKLEFQKRKSAHFHLIALDLKRVDIPAMGAAWCRIAGIDDQDGTWQAFDVKYRDGKGEELRNPAAYAAKYVSKDVLPEDFEGVRNIGRFWGTWNIKKDTAVSYYVPPDDLLKVNALIRERLGYSEYPWPWYTPENCTFFAGNAGENKFGHEIALLLSGMGYRIEKSCGLEVKE